MKKLILIIAIITTARIVNADCVATTQTYVSCKPGYYMGGTILTKKCVQCPAVATDASGNNIYGTSPDYNTGAVATCWAPDGTYNDDSGTYVITNATNDKCTY